MNPPAFQFYPDDFIGGTQTMAQGEVGAYILLLCHQWQSGKICPDAERLKMVARGEVSGHVLAKFPHGKNARLEAERQKQRIYREKQRINGALGGRPAKPNPNPTVPFGLSQTEPKKSSPSPSPSPSTKNHKASVKRQKWPMQMVAVVEQFESRLGELWENDRSKWLKRVKNEFSKSARVGAELGLAIKEGRIKTTPAQYAEQIWKEFQ